jgi:hypothetical protein
MTGGRPRSPTVSFIGRQKENQGMRRAIEKMG